MKKNCLVSWSSGKDSAFALLRALNDPTLNVVGLVTTHVNQWIPIQGVPLSFASQQAKLLDLPLYTEALPIPFPSNQVYQQLFIRAAMQAGHSIDAIIFGDLFCNGIEQYRRSFLEPAGYECLFPIMNIPPEQVAKEIVEASIKAKVVTINTELLSRHYLWKDYNAEFIESLPNRVDVCGENGEFHSVVYDFPHFSSAVTLTPNEKLNYEKFAHQGFSWSTQ